MGTITTKDNATIFYKDWGKGDPIVFSHGWPLSADAWDEHLYFFASKGYRVIAHDRRGHGRSSQTWTGNDMDTYAEDLAALIEKLDLRNVTLVGHSTGGGEVTRYTAKYGSGRVGRLALVSAIPPVMLKSDKNPNGTPLSAFDQIRMGLMTDRAQYYKDLSSVFYGANRSGSHVSQGVRDHFWQQSMQCGFKAAYDCVRVFSETDLTEDLKRINTKALIVHGDDDQIVPIAASAQRSVELLRGAVLSVYRGAPHGLPTTHREQLSADLLGFLKG
jgi:non-heme chloroperoxidase